MIAARMPSPIGHALAGVAVALAADLIPGDRKVPGSGTWHQRRALVCAGLGAAPDLDLLVAGTHRTATHSLFAVLIVGVAAAALAANAGRPIARVTLVCAAAYGSHLLLDWLGVDNYPPRGIMALWPISHAWYISDLDVFRQTARLHLFARPVILTNVKAIAQEIAILGPIVIALGLIRVKALARLAPEMTGRDHPAE